MRSSVSICFCTFASKAVRIRSLLATNYGSPLACVGPSFGPGFIRPPGARFRVRSGRTPSRCLAPPGQDRAGQNEHESEPHPKGEALVENRHPEDRGDRRVHVRDDRPMDGSNLRDQGEEEQERDSGADHRQHSERVDDSDAGHGVGPLKHRRCVGDGSREREPRCSPSPRAPQSCNARGSRPRGVADDHEPDLDQRGPVRRPQAQADDERHADQAQQEPGQACRPQVLAVACGGRDHHSHERYCGVQQPGQRARDVLLGVGEKEPGPTSTPANTSNAGQRRPRSRHPPRCSAKGSRSRVAIVVRTNTRVAGEISLTATRMKRYGMPQIKHIAANSNRPRRVTAFTTYVLLVSSAAGER